MISWRNKLLRLVFIALKRLEINLVGARIGRVPCPCVLLVDIGFYYILCTQVLFELIHNRTTTLWLADLLATVESFWLYSDFDCQDFALGLLRSMWAVTFLNTRTGSIIHQVNSKYFLFSLFTSHFVPLEKLLGIKMANGVLYQLL
jgi:hypothetical protein